MSWIYEGIRKGDLDMATHAVPSDEPIQEWNASIGRYLRIVLGYTNTHMLHDWTGWGSMALMHKKLTTGPMTNGVSVPVRARGVYVVYTYFQKGVSPILHAAALRPHMKTGLLQAHHLVTERKHVRRLWHTQFNDKLPRSAMSEYEAAMRAILIDHCHRQGHQ